MHETLLHPRWTCLQSKDLCQNDWCVFQWKLWPADSSTFFTWGCFSHFYFLHETEQILFGCCHNNGQKFHHPCQNSMTFVLRRPLSEQALAFLSMIPDFFVHTSSNPVRNDWCGALVQHPQLRDSEEAFPTLERARLFLGVSHVHSGLWGGDWCELDCRLLGCSFKIWIAWILEKSVFWFIDISGHIS